MIFSAIATVAVLAAGPGAVTLSLAEAQARAASSAPEVRLAAARVREAAATRVGAGVRLPVNPRLAVDGRPGLAKGARGDIGYAGQLDLLFEVSDAPGARRREADQRAAAATADAAVVGLEARLHVTEIYVGAALAGLRMDYARQTITLAERLLAASQERSRAGASSDIDVTSARTELAERHAQLRGAEAERLRLEAELRFALALPVGEAVQLTTSADTLPPVPPMEALLGRADGRHPDLRAIEARLRLLAASDDRLRHEAWPRVGVYGAVDASPASPVFGVVGLSVELPFFQRNQGPRAVVAAERQGELDRRDIARRRIDLAVRSSHAAYQARLGELEVLGRDGIPAAERRLALVEEGWRAGRFDIFRVTAAAQDLARLRSMRLEALARLWEDRLFLERLTGGWSDDRS
jgi:cobalt-zinc-cadmium efflux system outer membrane protein